jgi:hypothetical protein
VARELKLGSEFEVVLSDVGIEAKTTHEGRNGYCGADCA